MKLRIQGNSIRLRLTVPEVRELEETGEVNAKIRFDGFSWQYSLHARQIPAPIARSSENGGIEVILPEHWITGWLNSPKIGFEFVQQNGTKEGLKTLVEKDFACLTERPDEDESNHFPNPLADQGHRSAD